MASLSGITGRVMCSVSDRRNFASSSRAEYSGLPTSGLLSAGAFSASSRLHTESEVNYSPLRARLRHCPGVIPILSVNTRRNADTD